MGKKCTFCCKKYCNVCSDGSRPLYGSGLTDWTHKIVDQKTYNDVYFS